MVREKYDLIVIGSGPGGLSSAIYAARGKLRVLLIERSAPGGKMVFSSKIENWIGDKLVSGTDLSIRMYEHALKEKVIYKQGEVLEIENKSSTKQIVHLKAGAKIESKKIIIATGTIERVPENVKGIHEYKDKGVSYCVICDSSILANEPIAIIGGGNAAVEEGAYVSSVASKVYIFVRDSKFIAEKTLIDNLMKKKNVKVFFNSTVDKISGKNKLEELEATINGKKQIFKVSGLFPYIGQVPSTNFVSKLNITNKQGYIVTDENMETKAKGIFAIGDVRNKKVRQIVTAVSDGAIASKKIIDIL